MLLLRLLGSLAVPMESRESAESSHEQLGEVRSPPYETAIDGLLDNLLAPLKE